MRKITKWALGIALFLIVATAASYLFVDRELDKMFGGHTQVADLTLANEGPSSYALVNVNVLTPKADEFIPNQTVVISDGQIDAVTSGAGLPAAMPTVDGEGMFLVPGFTDSHVHTWQSENDLLLYVANGVTQIREMNGSEENLRWRREIENGRIGPDMFVVAPQLATFDTLEGWFVGWTQNKTIVRTDEDVEQAVRSFQEQGYDAVKSSSYLSTEAYEALGRVTKERSFPLVGHIPVASDLDDMWDADPTAIAHVEELMKALDREFGGYGHENAQEFLQFVRSRSADVADRVKERGAVVTSTLALTDSFPLQKVKLPDLLRSAELEYANPGITEGTVITSRGMGWLPEVNIYRFGDDWDEERRRDSLVYWKAYAEAVNILFDALLAKEVPILAGTDANVPVMVPGFSLHEEFRTLNDAGMSPAQVLASATTLPAKWAGTQTGQIRPGYKANLVLLRGNPLQDIEATESIEMVVVNGRRFSRADLDAMLRAVKAANDGSRAVELPI
jgi:hypothetical protein